MTKYLVVGASGLVGGHIYKQLKDRGDAVVGTYYSNPSDDLVHYSLSWTRSWSDYPDIIFIPASVTNVNMCEIFPEYSYTHNVFGISKLIDMFPTSRIVYFSSGYVFDGFDAIQDEKHFVNPKNVYGLHKTFAEHLIMARCPNHYTIIRTMFVYGIEQQQKNFVYQVLRYINNKQEHLGTFDDQFGNPTYTPKLAKMAIELADAHINGIFHVGGDTTLSKYQWARMICDVMGLDKSKLLRKTSDHETVQRPRNATVNNTILRYYDNPEEGLEDMKRKLDE